MSSIRILVAGAALATGLSLAACSSSSNGTATPPGPHSTASSAQHPTIGATRPASSSTAAPVALPGSGGDFCKQMSGAAVSLETMSTESDADRAAYLAKLKTLVAEAPADIKPDVEVLEQIDEQIVNGNAQADQQLETPATAAHLQHFLAWMQSHCPGVLSDAPTALPTG